MTRKQGSAYDCICLPVSFNTERFDSVYSDFKIYFQIEKTQIRETQKESEILRNSQKTGPDAKIMPINHKKLK